MNFCSMHFKIINLDSEIIISTNHAFIEITEQIQNACDKNLFTCGVYLDLQKVFRYGKP